MPKDRKLKAWQKKENEKLKQAKEERDALNQHLRTENTGYLEAEGEMEKTFKVTQDEIVKNVDVQTQAKRFDLTLELGPYSSDYSISGNSLLLGGRKGHIASFNWKSGDLAAEIHVGETVRAVKFLQNDNQFFAAAQKKYTFIYDGQGTELHKLKHHIEATHLDYLPYHYLLVTAGMTPYIKYQDVSTGDLVAELRTKLGPTSALAHNRQNAVMHAGHQNGVVTLWAPSMQTPLVKMQSSRGPVRDIAIDRSGNYMAVAGSDKSVKIWDLRKYEVLESYYAPTPASSVTISDTGLMAVSFGPHVQVWKDAFRTKQSAPYMNHLMAGKQTEGVQFCPFEDVLGVSHSAGFSSLLVPGSGEANIDSLEANPYMYASRVGRREKEVRDLMNKLQPDMIGLDEEIGLVDKRTHQQRLNAQGKQEAQEAQEAEAAAKLNPRTAIKGKNSAIRRLLRKKTKNVMDERKVRLQAALEKEKRAREKKRRSDKGLPQEKETGAAMRRFM